MQLKIFSLGVASLAASAPAFSATAPENECKAPYVFSGALHEWGKPTMKIFVVAPNSTKAASISLGKMVKLSLRPSNITNFITPPGRKPAAESYSGLIKLNIKHSGAYRIASNMPLWIDVIKNDNVVAASGHQHGPACSGIRKMVDFQLGEGVYFLQLSGNATAGWYNGSWVMSYLDPAIPPLGNVPIDPKIISQI